MNPLFYSYQTWRRIFLKAFLMLLIFNVAFIILRPFDSIADYSVFGTIVPLRPRLMRGESSLDDQAVPIETLLHAHEISAPKGPNEYRVVVLGDSGINGFGNSDDETITAYLNKAGVQITGKKLHVYNLAVPIPSMSRDLLIADAALDYHPDMYIWFVTLHAFQNVGLSTYLDVNRQHFSKLVANYHLTDINALAYGNFTDSWWQHSVFEERFQILHWMKFQMYMFQEGTRVYVETDLPNLPLTPVARDNEFRNPTWKALSSLPQLTHLPILVVNEPILVTPKSKPGANVNYNIIYDRATYDDYRAEFTNFCKAHGLWCLDIWDAVPAAEYTDTPLHRTALGNAITASQVSEEIRKVFNSMLYI